MNYAANRHAEEGVDFSHPFRVTLCQVVINCDNMNAFSFQRIQICRESSNQGFTFTGFHFGDSALMKCDTTDNLYLEVLHSDASPRCLSAHRKSLRQDVIQSFAVCNPFFEFCRFTSQFIICKR